MAKDAKKSRLAASDEELGEQLLQSVREMKAGLRDRAHIAEVSSLVETEHLPEEGSISSKFGTLVKTDGAVTRHDIEAIRQSIAQGITRDRNL